VGLGALGLLWMHNVCSTGGGQWGSAL